MKKILALLLCLILSLGILAGCAPAEKDDPGEGQQTQEPQAPETDPVHEAAYNYFAEFPEDKNVIEPADFIAKVEGGEEMFILDIRSAEDYGKGHIKGAVNIPFAQIGEKLESIPDDTTVMVYCYTGQTASQTTALLNIAGKFAKNVHSGFVNGISKVEGYEAYVDTTPVEVPGADYPVDEAIKEAIQAYFKDMALEAGGPFANFNVSPETVKQIIDEGSDEYFILSVRKAEDYAQGHLPGAVNIPYGAGMQEQFETVIPKDKTVIVYCYSGQTSSQTTAVLRLLGYKAYSMSGGMGKTETGSGWLGQGYETVTD